MNTVQITYTAEDYVAASRLHARASYLSKRALRPLLILWLIYSALALVIIHDWSVRTIALSVGGAALVTIGVALGIVILNAFILPRRSRRLFAQQRALHAEFTIAWDADSFSLEATTGSGRHGWGDFIRAAENREIILLFQSDMLFNMLPKRALSDAQIADIRAALIAHSVKLRRFDKGA
jgi:hypothetical protein